MITDAINEERPEHEHISARVVGKVVKALGFVPKRTPKARGYVLDLEKLCRLNEEFGLPPYRETSLMSLTSLSREQPAETTPEKSLTETEKAEKTFLNHASGMPIQSDVSDVSDVSTEGVFTLQDIKALFWVDGEFTFHPCGICGYSKLTAWKAETFKGQLFWICEDCKQEWENQRKVE